ncbi:MAG: 50S ribosomal protein L22 [Clostridia bacterium]|nr:50S ribosomal protein L22 [Clostridia bacterium]
MAEEIKAVRAIRREVRISPRKVAVVLDLIRGKDLALAKGILRNTPKAASPVILKLLKEAESNAEHNFHMDKENLYVSECYAGAGTTLKRVQPRAQGRAFRIMKRASHITVCVAPKE